MADIDDLDRCIDGLQHLQRISWRLLATEATTVEESKAARNQLRRTNSDLRTLLDMRSQRARFIRQGAVQKAVRRSEPAAC